MRESQESQPTTEQGMDTLVGYILFVGVVLSVVLIGAGVLWRWVNTGALAMDYELPRMNLFRFVLNDWGAILGGGLRPRVLVNLGITVLLLTPYVRVLASLLFFLLVDRNWKYTAFTGFVLAALTYSLFLT